MFNRSESPGWSDLVLAAPPVLRPLGASDPFRAEALLDEPVVVHEPVLSPYVRSWRKRALDLVVGVPLALLALPVVLVLAVVVLLNLRAWPFFVQHRVGRDWRPFRIVKLRTLPPDAPRNASKSAIGDVETTRLARYLRRTHLDELPQLFLVVRGSMSLVGPRPEMAQLMDNFNPSEADFRTKARPGCTGLWQISRDADREIYESPQYDREYLQRAGALLDLTLLWSTVRRLLRSGVVTPVEHRFRERSSLDV
jgi:lipopolysaccharide/colanic/teichoic acid biosynthesis glycosyltransferase